MLRNRIDLAVLLTVLIAVAASMASAGDEVEAGQKPKRLSEFRLSGLNGTSFDSTETLSKRPLVITFWRLHQKQSLRALKDLQQLGKAVAPQEVAIVSVVAGEVDRAAVERMTKELGIAFPVLFDPTREVFADLGGIVAPSTWFVDRDGVVRDAYPGYRRDFLRVAKINIDLLRGQIDEAQRAELLRTRPPRARKPDLAGAPTRHRLALRLLEKGQRQAALEQLRKAWQSEPPLVEAGVRLGILLLEDARNAEALEVLERASELAPANALASGARGVALIRLGHERKGTELLRRSLEQPAEEPLLYYEMATVSERSGALDDARRYYRLGLELMLGDRAVDKGH